MLRLKYKTLEEFWKDYGKNVDSETCIISDIDNVWFGGFFDFRTWFSRFSDLRVTLMDEIVKKSAAFLLFTNRGFLGAWAGGYVSQIVERFTDYEIDIYETSKQFVIRNDFKRFGVVKNANKPSKSSLKVIELLLRKYKKVFYVSSREAFIPYKDLLLINLAEETLDEKLLKKLTFVDIINK